jgi:hypothetical protein
MKSRMVRLYVNVLFVIDVDVAILWQTMVIGILVVTVDIQSSRKGIINNCYILNFPDWDC